MSKRLQEIRARRAEIASVPRSTPAERKQQLLEIEARRAGIKETRRRRALFPEGTATPARREHTSAERERLVREKDKAHWDHIQLSIAGKKEEAAAAHAAWRGAEFKLLELKREEAARGDAPRPKRVASPRGGRSPITPGRTPDPMAGPEGPTIKARQFEQEVLGERFQSPAPMTAKQWRRLDAGNFPLPDAYDDDNDDNEGQLPPGTDPSQAEAERGRALVRDSVEDTGRLLANYAAGGRMHPESTDTVHTRLRFAIGAREPQRVPLGRAVQGSIGPPRRTTKPRPEGHALVGPPRRVRFNTSKGAVSFRTK